MRIVGNDPTLSRQLMATASGAISAAGKSLIVNTDGTVTFPTTTSTDNTEAVTTAFAEVRSGHDVAGGQSVIYDTNAQRFVLNFKDGDNSNYGTSIVIEIDSSDFSLSYGTPVVFHSAASQAFQSCFDSSNNKVVIVYKGNSDSDGRAIVGTVDNSDNSISFGTVAKFNSTNNCTEPHTCFDSTNNKVIVTWQNNSNSSYGTAAVGTVSGTDISFGTAAVFESASTTAPKPVHDVGANKIVIQYVDVGNSYYGTGIVGTVSGTDISFGSAVVYNSSTEYGVGQPVYDSTNNKTVFVYQDYGDTEKGKARVVSISGTTPSYGTEVTFESQKANPISATFDSNIGKVAIGYYDETPTNMRHITGTVDGTDISFGSELDITSDNGQPSAGAAAFDPNTGKVLYVARNVTDSDKPYATVVQVGGTSTEESPLTTENFIGTSAHSAADGAKVLVNTQGAVDDNQSGLTAGQTYYVDKNGALQLTTNTALSLGSETEYTSDASNFNRVAFDSNSNRIVIAHKNGSNNNGTATVGSVSGTSITFGTTVAFDSSGEAEFYGIDFDSNLNKIVIAYRDTTDSNKGKAIVGTVDSSDNSISFGSEAEFTTNNAWVTDVCFDSSNNKMVIVYSDLGNSSYGTAVVATVSGTSISFGTPVVINSANTADIRAVFDPNENKVVIAYKDLGNSYYGTGIIGTVSGTSISFGSESVFESASLGDYIGLAYDTTNQKVVVAYHDDGNSSYGTAAVGTVSGTSISFGTPVVFEEADNAYIDATFDASTGKVVIAYRDVGNSNAGTYVVGTVSGTSISFGTPATFNTNTEYIGLGYDSNAERVVIAYKDAGDGDDGTVRVLQNANDLSGSLATDAVTAGTALSATKLLVKG